MDREQIIEALNNNLRAELSALEMYSAHARAIPEDAIAQGVRAIAAVEQRHARDLAARIKTLGGTPVEPGGVLRLELAEEQQAIKDYAVEIAEIMEDEETLDMLQENLNDEIQHSRWMKAHIAALARKARSK